MKLNEFKNSNKNQLDELDLSSFVGDVGSAAIRSRLKSLTGQAGGQMSTVDQLAQDKFIKDFVGRTSAELLAAIKSGAVVTGSTTPQTAQSQSPDTATQVQQTPAQIRQQKQQAAAAAAQRQMAPVSKLPTNQPAVQAANIRQQKQNAALRGAAVAESTSFDKLNAIFESIVQLDEQAGESISDWIVNQVSDFLGGSANLQKNMPVIKQQADAVQAAYGNGGMMSGRRIKEPLTKLANLAYSMARNTGRQSTRPQQATQATQATNSQQRMQQPTTATSQATPQQAKAEQSVYMQVKGMLDKLDTKGKQRILASLQKSLNNSTVSYATAQQAAAAPAQQAKPAFKNPRAAKAPGPASVSIGGQKISPNDPLYAKLMKGQTVAAESKKK